MLDIIVRVWPSCCAYPIAASHSTTWVNQLLEECCYFSPDELQASPRERFGSIHTTRAGAVTQKHLFERWHFFFKPGEANSSWLAAAFCTVWSACILNIWFYISFFHFSLLLLLFKKKIFYSFLHPCALEKPSFPARAEIIWYLNTASRMPRPSH